MKHYNLLIIIVCVFFSCNVRASDQQLIEKIQLLEQKVQRLEEIIAKNNTQDTITEQKSAENYKISKDKQDEVKIQIKPFPKIESTDGKYSIALNAIMQNDMAFFNHYGNDVKEGAMVRNARVSISGKLGESWSYFLQTNLANAYSNPTYALITYHFNKDFALSIGKMCEVFGLENSQQTRDHLFLEKSLISNIKPANKTGVMAIANGNNWFATLGGFGNYSDHTKSQVYKNNYSVTTRIAYLPIYENNLTVHLGINAGYQKSNQLKKVKYRARAESELSPYLMNIAISNVQHIQSYGIEFAASRGPFMLQSEYINNILARNKIKDVKFKGGYIEAAWILTGESRDYNIKRGIFKGVVPLNPFNIDTGGIGAWELALRYNYLTLNNKKYNIFGGAMRNVTLGMNWYPSEYVKIMTNYSFIKADRYSAITKKKPRILMLRAQIGF